ncbi:Trans-enoyl reductase [Lachnellula arida]|uniref:Trans-enoyl reductase n=1 Tax=Lachnellula arida TaxID=1316785 RepID=A0A8T9BHI8_9HELO|nr:Trans-enoyl reductase [Lachnellula arida]
MRLCLTWPLIWPLFALLLSLLIPSTPRCSIAVQQLGLFMDTTSPGSLSHSAQTPRVISRSETALGDRVAGAVHGNNSLEPRVGAFAQYVGATAELLLKIPDMMTFEEASTISASWLIVLTMFGAQVALDGEYRREASAADRALSAMIFAATQTLLDNGLIKSRPVRVLADRWAGVIQGVDIIRTGAVSGQKLVVRVD